MQHDSTAGFSKAARNAAQVAYVKGIGALECHGGLSEPDSRFLRAQRPCGVDGEGRIVLEFASPAEAAAAGGRAVLTRLARALRVQGLAADMERRVTAPKQAGRTPFLYRVGPTTHQVLYLPAFLASVTPRYRQMTLLFLTSRRPHPAAWVGFVGSGGPRGHNPRLIIAFWKQVPSSSDQLNVVLASVDALSRLSHSRATNRRDLLLRRGPITFAA